MRYQLAAALLSASLSALPVQAEDALPPELVGIWASDGAVFNERGALFEGQAVYLRADGRGMLIGGPPPIGVQLISRYDAQRKVLVVRIFSGEEPGKCADGEFAHDPAAKTLNNSTKLHQRNAGLPPGWVEYIGRKPARCSWE
jgi:hypothetical protein